MKPVRFGMADLHSHTFLSDGELSPAELFARAEHAARVVGGRWSVVGASENREPKTENRPLAALAVTDHVDWSTVDSTVPALQAACARERAGGRVLAVPGAEITHVRPAQIAELVRRCRQLGAAVVLVHGETIVEPVPAGTNRAAIEAGADVLAHPGLLTAADARLAAARGVRLEISARAGHSLTNGHVAALALRAGARLSFGSDSHAPGDLCALPAALSVLRGAGLSPAQARRVLQDTFRLAAGLARRLRAAD